MEKSEIIEGNKLIAEFMGAKFKNDITFHALNRPEEDLWLPFHGICKHSTIDLGRGQILQYHSSWDWLMPVVEKIESIKDEHHGYFGVHICSNSCTIQATNFRPAQPLASLPHYFADYVLDSKIEATWLAIVEFIKWYNKQKQ